VLTNALRLGERFGWVPVSLQANEISLHGARYIPTRLRTSTAETNSTAVSDCVLPASNQKWTLWLHGNGSFFEHSLESLTEFAEEVNCNLLTFNYRGVGKSQGVALTEFDLVVDARAFFEYLLSCGVLSGNILIYGFSLGGGVRSRDDFHYFCFHDCFEIFADIITVV
jgi:alpha/beta superfamily hydrolase